MNRLFIHSLVGLFPVDETRMMAQTIFNNTRQASGCANGSALLKSAGYFFHAPVVVLCGENG